jgi:hypothetical protein
MDTRDRERARAKGITPDEDLATAVRTLIATDGEPVALSRLHMSMQTVARLGAGLPVNRSSIELARLRLGLADDDDA